MWTTARARLGFGIALALLVAILIGWRNIAPLIGQALAQAFQGPALAVSVACQVLALAVCAMGLRVLNHDLTLPAALLSRWGRDAIGALPIAAPGLGEAAGVRILALFGLSAGAALVVSTADILAETLAQAVYSLLAVVLAPSSLQVPPPRLSVPAHLLASGCAAVVAVPVLAYQLMPTRLRARAAGLLSAGIGLLRSPRFGASLALHLAAWAIGGVQILLLTHFLGHSLSLGQAFSLEGLVFALRAIFFFVPAGIGVQEAAVTAIAASYGLPPVEAATIAVLLRVRDAIVLLPALLTWAGIEARRTLRRPRRTKVGPKTQLPCT